MKTYQQLTEAGQEKAVEKAASSLLAGILEGAIRFNDTLNRDTLQERIDRAITRAEGMQTPWFAHEYIMDTCQEEIMGMARADAEDSLYPEASEHCVHGIAV